MERMINKVINYKYFTAQQLISAVLIALIMVGFMALTGMQNKPY